MHHFQDQVLPQQNSVAPVSTTIWQQLTPTSQQQLAHLVAQLIQRVRVKKIKQGESS